jgi:hypothetical protein
MPLFGGIAEDSGYIHHPDNEDSNTTASELSSGVLRRTRNGAGCATGRDKSVSFSIARQGVLYGRKAGEIGFQMAARVAGQSIDK